MTARQKVERTQRVLRVIVSGSVLLWAGAALLAGLVAAAALGRLDVVPPRVASALPLLAIVVAVVTLAVLAWRGRFAWSFRHVALWIEERAPELRYALVTAIDPRFAESAGPTLDPIVARVQTTPFLRRAALHTTAPAFIAFVVALGAFLLLPASWGVRLDAGTLLRPGGNAAEAPMPNRLVPLKGRVMPPTYANQKEQSLDEPSTITALRGSRVTLCGHGIADGVQVTLGDSDVSVKTSGKEWEATFTMSDTLPAALKLVDRQYSRLIVVNPIVDQPPSARLLLPVRDTTLRTIAGTLHLSAEFADDVGLGAADFEYIISNTGEGDNTEARVGSLGRRALGGTRGAATLDVPYASLKLREGDLLSVRAVVTDNNTLYGPGKGYSETRSIRIARKGEYDSLAVTAAPPSADTAMMTLRMLIIATEGLDKQRGRMKMDDFVDSAGVLSGKATSVRQKIQRIISEQTGNGEIAANPLLVEALDAMWEATRSLAIADTRSAIPQLWTAYKALEKLRNEKRYYLRGRLPEVVVNIERVRLTGTDTGTAKPIEAPRPLAGTELERLRPQYAEAVRLLQSKPERAVELFTLMRVATLRSHPAIAASLGDAVTAIQRGTDVTLPLLHVRRALEGGAAGAIDSLPAWTGTW